MQFVSAKSTQETNGNLVHLIFFAVHIEYLVEGGIFLRSRLRLHRVFVRQRVHDLAKVKKYCGYGTWFREFRRLKIIQIVNYVSLNSVRNVEAIPCNTCEACAQYHRSPMSTCTLYLTMRFQKTRARTNHSFTAYRHYAQQQRIDSCSDVSSRKVLTTKSKYQGTKKPQACFTHM